jgi:redox-sensitive bicupin YhaK (pirin superfamily)
MESEASRQRVVHRADTRGYANHGWLKSRFTFSFAEYYDPERMGFGALRVINDDEIAGGSGFGMHPHKDMEIVTIPISGAIRHEDNMGHVAVTGQGEVQVMSAGTGVLHSEYNASETETGKFLQIWILSQKDGIAPRYAQAACDSQATKNAFSTVVNPQSEGGLWIHQDAWISRGVFDDSETIKYQVKRPGNGVYVFLIAGSAEIGGESLGPRDGIGIWDADVLSIRPAPGADILLFDIPMIEE